jgi:hypothetical protein
MELAPNENLDMNQLLSNNPVESIMMCRLQCMQGAHCS